MKMSTIDAKKYTEKCVDEISFRLHSNAGYEVDFTVWQDTELEYHVFAEPDMDTCDFLYENYPDEHGEYLDIVEKIPCAHSKHLDLINSFIASETYNSIRPVMEDEFGWLVLDESEIDRD